MRTSRFGVARGVRWLPRPAPSGRMSRTRIPPGRLDLPLNIATGTDAEAAPGASPMADQLIPPEGKATAVAERRHCQRYPFICPAQLIDLGGNARISARTADLSLDGCYIDTLNPFPVGTRVRLQMAKNNQRLEMLATVTACHRGSGMGLIFEQPTPAQKATLDAWLQDAASPAETAFPAAAAGPAAPSGTSKPYARFAARLAQILERKGVLTHSEAEELLRDLNS